MESVDRPRDRARGTALTGALTGVLTVLTTVDSAEVARELARDAVEARLAACAQISGPVTSVYRWKDELRSGQEWQVLLKTTEAAYPALEAALIAAHPYDTPEVIATPVVRGSADYLAWVAAEVTAG
ncbi:divalent cation tolerance protein CutA [Streptomyces sp. APSN-46.1]|uniref:divalent-cation tolerance protein CutA n=1 Tax=Streptomyces sp. APSN-46.1 TaxID=2929049 RepID=UPI001FB4AC3B|nr:divalent-cation tolerance protein CutA [Streptomyces sp. APSN-46.1]MCJ1677441.1 divalent cation tolerance protein CutA [Streptomyces sp. APSN-46.1]